MSVDFEVLAIRRAQKGDEQAWGKLFEWHFEAIYGYCLSLAGGQEDAAEEITQEVFVTAARCISRFKSRKGTFRSWLLGIAKKRFMKLESKKRRRRRYEAQSSIGRCKTAAGSSEEHLVYEVLGRLPAHYRMVLESKYLEGHTMDEIAEREGVTVKAIESLLGRAREKFGDAYKQMRD